MANTSAEVRGQHMSITKKTSAHSVAILDQGTLMGYVEQQALSLACAVRGEVAARSPTFLPDAAAALTRAHMRPARESRDPRPAAAG